MADQVALDCFSVVLPGSDPASLGTHARQTVGDAGWQAIQACITAAYPVSGRPAVHLRPVLEQIDQMFGDLGQPESGYWRVRSNAETSCVQFGLSLGRDLPRAIAHRLNRGEAVLRAGTELVVACDLDAGLGTWFRESAEPDFPARPVSPPGARFTARWYAMKLAENSLFHSAWLPLRGIWGQLDQVAALPRRLSRQEGQVLLAELRSGLSAAATAMPAEPGFEQLTAREQLSRLGEVAKPAHSVWVADAPLPDRHAPRPGRAPVTRTLATLPVLPRQEWESIAAGTALPPPGRAQEQPPGRVLYAFDGAILGTLISTCLGQGGSGAPSDDTMITVLKVVIQPRLVVVQAVQMTAGDLRHTPGLGLLAPASGRLLTRTLAGALDARLGPAERFRRVHGLLGWLEIAACAQDARLAVAPAARSKVVDLLHWLWDGKSQAAQERALSGRRSPRPELAGHRDLAADAPGPWLPARERSAS